jgi:glycosyltransferase involved in cell wall biosynthesis
LRLLVVSEWFPYPPIAGAKIRAYNLIRQLARLAELDLVAQVRTLTPEQLALGKDHLGQFCRTVDAFSVIPYQYSVGKAFRTLVDPVPPVVRYMRNLPMEQAIVSRWSQGYDAAVATISGYPSATLRSLVAKGVRPLIADSLELGVFRPKKQGLSTRSLRSSVTWWRMRRFTRKILRDVDVVTVTSKAERDLFGDLLREPDQCVVLPSVLDLRDYTGHFGQRDHNALLYAGSFGYIANYEAMQWFTQEVFGHIAGRENVKVRVTGNTAGRDLDPLRQSCPQIEFTGFVDDIRPYFAGSGICIVPILSGGSTRLKVVEAMAWGTPVVSTRIGAEGLEVTHGENIMLADAPADFASAIERLIGDRSLWQRISDGGRRLVEERYSADRMYRQLEQVLSSVTTPGRLSTKKGHL